MIFCSMNPYFIKTVFWRACQVKNHSSTPEYRYIQVLLIFSSKDYKKVNTFEKTFAYRHLIHSLLNIFLSIGIRMNSTADEKKNEDTHETEGTAENEINNLKLYVLGSIIILTLLGNFLILFLVSSNILLLLKFRSDLLRTKEYK